MEWTLETPTKPGWYWCHEPYFKAYMFLLIDHKGVLWTDEVGEYDRKVTNLPEGTKWMGPIEEPLLCE